MVRRKSMITKEVIGDELYVYMNGNLLYKRWLSYGYGILLTNPKCALDVAQGNYKAVDTESFNQSINDNPKNNR